MDKAISKAPKKINSLEVKKESLKRFWYKYSRNKLSVIGLIVLTIIILSAIFADQIVPYPEHIGAFTDYENANLRPSRKYICGTDQYGRDIFSRMIYSFRNAFIMCIGVLGISAPIGVMLGLIAGYYQGTLVESIIMRLVDIFLSLPSLVLALAVSAMLEPTLLNSMLAVCFSWWAWYTRITYNMAVSVKNEYYIKSTELIGASVIHIIVNEILPNCFGPIFTKLTLDIGQVILIGASLSFVGLGEQPPNPALGTMISDGARYLPHFWWQTLYPAIAIMIIILSCNLVGDGIKDALSTDQV